jgi:hypothetical protein
MSQIVQQSTINDLIVTLLDSGGSPVTGLTYDEVTCSYRKEGQSSFTSKTLTALVFDEIGSGVYTIEFSADELDTNGAFLFIVNGSDIVQSVVIVTIEEESTNDSVDISVSTCTLTGHLFNATGEPLQNVAVSARVLNRPAILNNVAVDSEIVSAKTDENGQFFLTLIRNLDVVINIPKVNYERRLVVPNVASANLFTEVA